MGFRTSLPLGRWFGVEFRLHTLWAVMLSLAVVWAVTLHGNPLRGVALWGLALLAVLVRELARGLTAAWFGVELRSVLLLPSGGVTTFGLAGAGAARAQRAVAVAGMLANVVFGLTLAGLILGVSPNVPLLAVRWISPEHLLRAAVWLNLLLAFLNLLPVWPLDGGRLLDEEQAGTAATRGTLLRMGPAAALALIAFGLASTNWWAFTMGVALLLGGQMERQGLAVAGEGDSLKVRDVMLAEYSILSASATLEDAVVHARQTLQDVFPVVRAGNMVGAVSRAKVLHALESSGNGYVQGIMTRTFQTATPGDGLVSTLGRVTGAAGSQLVPVVEGERIVGIITPQNLQRAVGLLKRRAGLGSVPGARSAGAGSDEETRAAERNREDERD